MKREELVGKSLSELAKIYNELNPDAHLKKFASKEKGIERILALEVVETNELDYEDVVDEPKTQKLPHGAGKTYPTSKGTRKISPYGAVSAMGLLFQMVTNNSELTRKEYIEAAVERGIKKTTAGAQWSYTKRLDQLEKDLAGRF